MYPQNFCIKCGIIISRNVDTCYDCFLKWWDEKFGTNHYKDEMELKSWLEM